MFRGSGNGLRATLLPRQPRPASCPHTVARQPPADFTCARLTLGSKEDRWRRATIMHAAGPLVVETLAVSTQQGSKHPCPCRYAPKGLRDSAYGSKGVLRTVFTRLST